jgi:hypothetical protein
MADPNDHTFSTDEVQANRAREQGLGQGQREMDAGRDPSRFQSATAPEQRSFDHSLDAPPQAAAAADPGKAAPDGHAAGVGDVDGDLGAGTPPNVDVHKLGQDDRPEQDWGETAGEGAAYSANHTRRAIRTEADRAQGAKTRAANKDQVSRRG